MFADYTFLEQTTLLGFNNIGQYSLHLFIYQLDVRRSSLVTVKAVVTQHVNCLGHYLSRKLSEKNLSSTYRNLEIQTYIIFTTDACDTTQLVLCKLLSGITEIGVLRNHPCLVYRLEVWERVELRSEQNTLRY